jgi:glycosyltransferase involved in cell wall biosynthesis
MFNGLAKLGLKLLVKPLRRWDYKAAQRPNFMIANSSFTKSEIKKYYGRDSVVIHPPVDVEQFAAGTSQPLRKFGLIIAGRQVPYKRFDLAVAACTKLELPLTVIGNGPEHNNLVKLAGQSILFTDAKSTEELVNYFQSAACFIFPGEDDFGIVAVEAMAAGTPVIAFNGGGAIDYIIGGKTGLFFDEQTVDSLVAALQQFTSASFSSINIQTEAAKFSRKEFRAHILDFLSKTML